MTQNKKHLLAPGNVLQNMYIEHRLNKYYHTGMRFVELGSGNGYISNILLRRGLTGIGFDLNKMACKLNAELNRTYIEKNKYRIENYDFFQFESKEKFDVIITSHVLEHLTEEELYHFFIKSKKLLNKEGKIVIIVPANMKFWGIEDETAGHYRRFEANDFYSISEKHILNLQHIAGLTYPLSNILLGLSNHLTEQAESWKKGLDKKEQTRISASGAKNIKFKTYYPAYFRYIINKITMLPFYWLQIMCKKKTAFCLVIYCELSVGKY